MSGNTFGKIFKVTTFGESHGKALGCIIDGCPPNLKIDESDIQRDLDRRKPGQSKYTTQRKEDDKIDTEKDLNLIESEINEDEEKTGWWS